MVNDKPMRMYTMWKMYFTFDGIYRFLECNGAPTVTMNFIATDAYSFNPSNTAGIS